MSKKPVILTGLRANNELHIGNYFGALLPLIDQIEKNKAKYQINLFVPDLHSITTEIDYKSLQIQIMSNLKVFVASGLPLDDADVHIYRQSYISAHSELTWILDCFTSFGEMNRMTQFKDKVGLKAIEDSEEKIRKKINDLISELEGSIKWNENEKAKIIRPEDIKNPEAFLKTIGILGHWLALKTNREKKLNSVTLGLFNYPVLMAADILLYGAEYVPVGDDQTQHLEFTRDIAERMNKKFSDIFTVPKPVKEQHKFFAKDQGLRIKDLVHPDKKMSKSADSDKGVIFLQDKPEEAKRKIMSATTDGVNKVQYDPENQPGISNLIEVYGLIKGKSAKEAEAEFAGQTQYGEFKQTVAEAVVQFLSDFQSRLAQVNQGEIVKKLSESESLMNEQANKTLLKVQQAIGLR